MKNQSIRFSATLPALAMVLTCRPACAQNATPTNKTSLSSVASREQLNTALLSAITQRAPERVQDSLTRGADPNAEQEGTPALVLASSRLADERAEEHRPASPAEITMVTALLAAGAKPDATDKAGSAALAQSAWDRSGKLCELLLAHLATVDLPNKRGVTPLMQAVRNMNLPVVKMLLAHMADANFRTQDGSTPLAIFLLHKMDDVYWRIPFTGFTDDLHDPIFQTLIDHGADLKVKRNDGSGLLILAVQQGCVDYAHFLLTQGADINAQKQNGATPLLAAIRLNKTPIVRFLLANGADPNIAARNGATPLREGVNQGNFAIVEMLLKKGANPSVSSGDGQTPMQIARKMKLTALVNLLTTNGAKE